MTVADLRARASELEITGRSSMNKEELLQAVADAEEQTAMMKANGGSMGQRLCKESRADSESDSSKDSKRSSEDKSCARAPATPTTRATSPLPRSVPTPPSSTFRPRSVSTWIRSRTSTRWASTSAARWADSATAHRRSSRLVVYGVFFVVFVALVIGGKIAADKLDQPPDTIAVKARIGPRAARSRLAPIDFPRTTDPDCASGDELAHGRAGLADPPILRARGPARPRAPGFARSPAA